MKNFALGLGIGLVGTLLWVIASVVGGFGEAVSGERSPLLYALMVVGFIVMLGAPLTFWVILPIKRIVGKRKYK